VASVQAQYLSTERGENCSRSYSLPLIWCLNLCAVSSWRLDEQARWTWENPIQSWISSRNFPSIAPVSWVVSFYAYYLMLEDTKQIREEELHVNIPSHNYSTNYSFLWRTISYRLHSIAISHLPSSCPLLGSCSGGREWCEKAEMAEVKANLLLLEQLCGPLQKKEETGRQMKEMFLVVNILKLHP